MKKIAAWIIVSPLLILASPALLIGGLLIWAIIELTETQRGHHESRTS